MPKMEFLSLFCSIGVISSFLNKKDIYAFQNDDNRVSTKFYENPGLSLSLKQNSLLLVLKAVFLFWQKPNVMINNI